TAILGVTSSISTVLFIVQRYAMKARPLFKDGRLNRQKTVHWLARMTFNGWNAYNLAMSTRSSPPGNSTLSNSTQSIGLTDRQVGFMTALGAANGAVILWADVSWPQSRAPYLATDFQGFSTAFWHNQLWGNLVFDLPALTYAISTTYFSLKIFGTYNALQ